MLVSVLSLLSIVVTIAVVIGIHEFGHYLAMRRFGVEVIEFTIGFGPTIWQRKIKSGTVFRLKAIWLGGYARPVMIGEKSMEARTFWQKQQIYVGGMLANVFVAMVVMTVSHYTEGTYTSLLRPYIEWAPVWSWGILSGLAMPLLIWIGTPFALLNLILDPVNLLANVSGPVGIATMGAAAVAKHTVWECVISWFSFLGFLSAAVAGFNMIPVFPLDGGRMLGFIVEKVLGKRINAAFQYAGLVVLLLIVIMAFVADGILLFGSH